MSTSLLYHAFGIQGYPYVRTRYEGGAESFTISLEPTLKLKSVMGMSRSLKMSTERKRASGITYRKPFLFSGGPSANRTRNLLIKSQLLCLVELTAQPMIFRIGPDNERVWRYLV